MSGRGTAAPEPVSLAIAAPALAVICWWSLDGGGYSRSDWLPGIAIVAALALVAACVLRHDLRPPVRAVTVAIALFGAYTVWSFASSVWAQDAHAAIEGSQRTLLYLGWFALFACLPWSTASARVAIVALVLAIAAAGAITLARVAGAPDPLRFFADARLAAPLDYQNAAAALWSMGALPALVLASRRETWTLLRPVLLASSGLMLGLGLLAESRGWLFTLPVIVIGMFFVTPNRVRLALFAAPVAAGLVLASGAILEVYRVAGGLTLAQATPIAGAPIDGAVDAVVLLTAGVAAAGIVMTAVDRLLIARISVGAGVRRGFSRGLLAAVLLALVVAGGWASTQDVSARADRAWSDFKQSSNRRADGTARDQRLTSVEGARYDYWRVGLNVWRAHPIAGAGQDNFARYYRASGRTKDRPRWVHSLALRLLAHTGIVGAILFAGFVLAAGWAIARAWRPRHSAPSRAVVAAALLPALVWLVHGSVDTLWEYPVLSAVALASAGIAAGRSSRRRRVRDAAPVVAEAPA